MSKPVSFPSKIAAGRTSMSVGGVVHRPYGMVGWVMNCTVAGCGRVNRAADQLTVSKGDWLLFPPKVVHDYAAEKEAGTWEHLWVYFSARPHWSDLMAWPRAGLGVLKIGVEDAELNERFIRGFEELLSHAQGDPRIGGGLAMNTLERLLLWLDTVNPEAVDGMVDKRIMKAVRKLSVNYAKPLDLPGLAAGCGLSPSRFSHLFSASLGLTPGQFLRQQRLNRARELLAMTRTPIKEMALELGFANQFHFSNAFAASFGIAPTEFRRQSSGVGLANPKKHPTQ